MTDTDLLIQINRGRVQGVFDMGGLEYVYMTEPRDSGAK